MKTLFILNDAPYGTEKAYNALRLAGSLSKRENEQVKVFLFGDAVACAKKDQKVAAGFYNLELMIKNVSHHKAEIGLCGTCLDARGISVSELTEGANRSTLEELTDWTIWADKVITF